MKGKEIRVRVAPSPTGFAHLGTAYAALFNFAFAKKNKGKFIIRLEDTDIEREVKGAEKAIYDGLSWLGLSWDEGPDIGGKFRPYRQSERLDIYKNEAEKLLKKNLAYKDKGAVRFKNPVKNISWEDLVRGKITFPGEEVTDFVLLKSNGYPTYNFAVVVDDLLMQISHVIRGEEHISNTPRQLALYHAMDRKPPLFAHIPTLRNKQRKKLSKRRDPVDLRIYQKEGFLSQALVNFLCLLGWSHPKGKEIFDLDEFVSLFDLKRVRKAGPIFDIDKLTWINGNYIRKLTDNELAEKLLSFSLKKDTKLLKEIAPIVKTRLNKLSDFNSLAGFFFKEPKVKKSLLGKHYKKHLNSALEALEKVDKWKREEIDQKLLLKVKDEGYQTGNFFMDLRVALTGNQITPPINDSIEILGKRETIKRLKKLI